ncbi:MULTISPECIES: hypothetical protein [unclassified Sphingomonas]|jgi:hypothetical protein|uniref:hypothetical protein n=1 Tax=unclassified Sphingomonas TaxID=196159 RepID=UPI00226AFD22|nr:MULTISPECIES: hypothetical protein [unclassified Sphingomonas]
MIALLLMLQAVPADTKLLARASTLTAAERPCVINRESTDITVCGRRDADRFRVPFIVHDAGDPRHESVGAERERLLHRTNPVEDLSPFLVGGGMAGVTASTSGGVGGMRDRPIAP